MPKITKNILIIILIYSSVLFFLALSLSGAFDPYEKIYDFTLPFMFQMILCIIFSTFFLASKIKIDNPSLFALIVIFSSCYIPFKYAINRWPGGDDGPGMAWLIFVGLGSIITGLIGAISLITIINRNKKISKKPIKAPSKFNQITLLIIIISFILVLSLMLPKRQDSNNSGPVEQMIHTEENDQEKCLNKETSEQEDESKEIQKVFKVDNFSDNHYAKIQIQPSKDFPDGGWVTIYNKTTGEEILKVNSNFLCNDLDICTNIIYQDFNFDNKKDFAILNALSCYGLPDYKIYLATNKSFIFSKEFTELSEASCGIFKVNYEKKRIQTMMKSGCCWHQYSDFTVENNKPKKMMVVTKEYSLKENGEILIITTEKLINGVWQKTTTEEEVESHNKRQEQ